MLSTEQNRTKTGATPEAKAQALAQRVQAFAAEKITEAVKERDLAAWLQAQSYSKVTSNSFLWIFNLPSFEQYSFNDFLTGEFNAAKTLNEFRRKTEKYRQLYTDLQGIKPQDSIVAALARNRTEDGRSWRYLVLVNFDSSRPESGLWLYEPGGVACAEHHCDVLYKAARGAKHICKLRYKTLKELWRESTSEIDRFSVVEFKAVAQELGEIPAAEREITRALMDYYSNLRKTRIPAELLSSK